MSTYSTVNTIKQFCSSISRARHDVARAEISRRVLPQSAAAVTLGATAPAASGPARLPGGREEKVDLVFPSKRARHGRCAAGGMQPRARRRQVRYLELVPVAIAITHHWQVRVADQHYC